MSTDHNGLPVLTLAGESTPESLQALALDIRQATAESGFFYLRGSFYDHQVIAEVRRQQRAFFDLPGGQKSALAIDINNRGYMAQGLARMHGADRSDEKEVFFWGPEQEVDNPFVVADLPLCGVNQWPAELHGFRAAVETYSLMVKSAGDRLLQAIALSLDAPTDFFIKHYEQPMLRGQLLRYPPTSEHENQFGVAPHTDFGCITLLLQEVDGLEVLMGDQWVAAPPLEDTLVINIGDLLERWSDCRLPSTKHRVRNKSRSQRHSIAMFYDPTPTAVVDPMELVGSSTEGYEPIAANAYILSRNKGAFAHYQEGNNAS